MGCSESANPIADLVDAEIENGLNCLFMVNIAFGVHLAEKNLKIANVWSESADPTADSVDTEIV
ncbi:MAG: hypothetical protein GY795_14565 [Desulfobacterales bacterium]|nr:hypothetical protein [Desulfobacterales bacterium]